MSVGWGLVAPVGISIGLMYKSVWPGKGWFIVSSHSCTDIMIGI